MGFRDLVAEVDSVVFDTLGDSAEIEGRPVSGMFSAPWLQPAVGRLNTGLREPRFVIRISDAGNVDTQQGITINLPEKDGGGDYTIVQVEPDGTGLVALILRMKA